MRSLRGAVFLILGGILAAQSLAAEPQRGGVIDVATVGEPPTLDPMASTTDLVGTITQHVFETLFTFDAQWNVVPLLAVDLPTIDENGTRYDIRLRRGVSFHDGSPLTVEDAVASLQRWLVTASRGKQAAPYVASVAAEGGDTIRITLKKPYAPLLSLLAFNNSAAVVMPKAVLTEPLTSFVGTGPYKLKERRPDQYIQLVRFDGYKPREGAADGYGGARTPLLDEIRFVPVPDPNTRLEGAIAGQFDFADSLAPEMFARLSQDSGRSEPVVLAPYAATVFVMNTKAGLLAEKRLRQAVQATLNPEDLLIAGFGDPKFYALNGALYPDRYRWHTADGVERYGSGDPETAAALMGEAGYDGRSIRILTSRQYEFHYKMAEVAQEYLKAAGFAVQLDVVDWATLTTRRANPDLWDIFLTHGPFPPEPSLNSWMSDDYPGWWATPAKHAAVDAFNAESDPNKRVALFAAVQKVFYDEAPVFKVGDFNSLSAKAKTLEGYVPSPWPYFWNVSTAKTP